MIDQRGRAVILDFGLARAVSLGASGKASEPRSIDAGAPLSASESDPLSDQLTQEGALLGTPAYIPPERYLGHAEDARGDQYSLCVALWEALYGERPFQAKRLGYLRALILKGDPSPPADARVIPRWLRALLRRGLSVDRDARFPDVHALIAALERRRVRQLRRALTLVSVPMALTLLGYLVYLLIQPGEVVLRASWRGRPYTPARVLVDGAPADAPGGALRLRPGLHRVTIDDPGFLPAEAIADVSAGARHELAFTLQHEQAIFELDVEPTGGSVFVDDVDYGSRLRNFAVDTGEHAIRVSKEGHYEQRFAWRAVAGETHSRFVSLTRAVAWSRPVTGVNLDLRWLGDINGDGLDDLAHLNFGVWTAYDPWNDAKLWRVVVHPGILTATRVGELDGDGVDDIVGVAAEDGRLVVRAWSSRARGLVEPRWTAASLPDHAQAAEGDDHELLLHDVGVDGQLDVLAWGVWKDRLVALDGATGRPLWSVASAGAGVRHARVDARAPVIFEVGGGRRAARDAGSGALLWSTSHEDEQLAYGFRPSARELGLHALVGGDGETRIVGRGRTGEQDSLWSAAARGGALGWRVVVARASALEREDAIGDVNGDGAPDVLSLLPDDARPSPGADGQERVRVAMIDGRGGRPLWTRPSDGGARLLRFEDGGPQVVVLVADGRLELRDAASGELLRQRADTPLIHPIAADWDGDGARELVGVIGQTLHAYTRSLAPLGTVPLTSGVLRLQRTRDANHDGFDELLVDTNGPTVITGPKVVWQRRAADAVRGRPRVADTDGDGEPELVVHNSVGASSGLLLFDARTGLLQAASDERPIMIRAPALLPRDDGGLDIITLVSGRLQRHSGVDARALEQVEAFTAYASPGVGDLDGDGDAELVMVSWDAAREVVAVDGRALRRTLWRRTLSTGAWATPLIIRPSAAAEPIVLLTLLDGTLVALRGRDGAPAWSVALAQRMVHAPAVADLDGDGVLELALTHDDGVECRSAADGALRWAIPGLGTSRSAPAIVDIDGDGALEIIAGSRARGLVALDRDGAPRWERSFTGPDGDALEIGSPLTVADLESDGAPELLLGLRDGTVHALSALDGASRWRFRTTPDQPIEAAPTAADVDGDGVLEVIVGGHDRHLYCLRHRAAGR